MRPLAPPLPDDLQALLAGTGTARTVSKGTIVVAEGEPAMSMYLIHEGSLRVYVTGEDGREVELNRLGPGDYFGEMMLASTVRTATVKALERSRLTLLTRHAVEQVLNDRPDFAQHLIRKLIERVQALSRNVQGLSSMDVYGRVVRLFNDLATDDGGRRLVREVLSQQQIADRVGASRAMVNRILKELLAGGYIRGGGSERARGGRIELLRPLPRHW
jgi:CRP/FNR family transcriptional regulator, cyclic AMP receptor protein